MEKFSLINYACRWLTPLRTSILTFFFLLVPLAKLHAAEKFEVLDGLSTEKYRPRLMIRENLFSANKYLAYESKGIFVVEARLP